MNWAGKKRTKLMIRTGISIKHHLETIIIKQLNSTGMLKKLLQVKETKAWFLNTTTKVSHKNVFPLEILELLCNNDFFHSRIGLANLF